MRIKHFIFKSAGDFNKLNSMTSSKFVGRITFRRDTKAERTHNRELTGDIHYENSCEWAPTFSSRWSIEWHLNRKIFAYWFLPHHPGV